MPLSTVLLVGAVTTLSIGGNQGLIKAVDLVTRILGCTMVAETKAGVNAPVDADGSCGIPSSQSTVVILPHVRTSGDGHQG